MIEIARSAAVAAGAGGSPPVGSIVFLVLVVVALSLGVLLVVRHFLPIRTTPAHVLVPVFFSLWLPACVVVLVPVDLASSTAAAEDEAARGIWLPHRAILVSWRITYWLTFSLTWFILPLLGEYSDSGYREAEKKLMYSLRSNAQYYSIMFGTGALGLVYVFITYGFTFTSLKALVMALSYCWGLALSIYLVGHGLVSIPRNLLRGANIRGRLRRIQTHAPKVHEKMEDAEATLEELEARVAELGRRSKAQGSAREFRDWIEELVDMAGGPEEARPSASLAVPVDPRTLPTVITEKYLADLTRDIVRARNARNRYVGEWSRLLQDAAETQAILDSAATKRLEFGRARPGAGAWDRFTILTPYLRHLLHFWALPKIKGLMGILLGLASVCIVESEVVKIALPWLSVLPWSVLHHPTSDGQGRVGLSGQMFAAFWLMYMSAAALGSISEVKLWNGRVLAHRGTTLYAACFFASQVARLSVPLSYNFTTLLSPEIYKKTVFYDFLGINLTAAGTWFDTLFPILVLVPVCATLFGLFGKIRRAFGFDVDIIDDEEEEEGYSIGTWREGRDLIERELNGTSIRHRLRVGDDGSDGRIQGQRGAPVLSIPGAASSRAVGSGRPGSPSVRTPFATSPSNGAVGRAGQAQDGDPEDENFFEAFTHRVRNTVDQISISPPKWWKDVIKKPNWMAGDDEEGGGGSRGGGGGGGEDIRRWFGGSGGSNNGGNGRIRL